MNVMGQDKKKRKQRPLRKKLRNLSQSPFALSLLSSLAIFYIKLVLRTNKLIVDPKDGAEEIKPRQPVIASVWHGQHILVAALPVGMYASALVSRNLDGEVTARIIEHFGHQTIRASGGREQKTTRKKGGVVGFLEMLSTLKSGRNVIMTADIPKGTRREAGLGIIKLSQNSGVPILPMASASSRRFVFKRAWDKATLPLPFGTTSICFGELLHVAADADDAALQNARRLLDDEMTRITNRAYELTGNPE